MVEARTREPRPEKVAVVDEVRRRFAESNAAILTEYRGLPVPEMEILRRALGAVGGDYKIFKNTLVRRAVQESGLQSLEALLEGPTAIAFVREDVAAVAKVLRDFARTNPNLVVKGGLIGSSLLDAKTTAALADLPSKDVLLAQLAGALAAPMQRFASLLAALPQKFAYALSALVDQRGGVPEAEPAARAEQALTEPPAGETAPTETNASQAASPEAVSTEGSLAEGPTEEAAPAEASVTDAVSAEDSSGETGSSDGRAETAPAEVSAASEAIAASPPESAPANEAPEAEADGDVASPE